VDLGEQPAPRRPKVGVRNSVSFTNFVMCGGNTDSLQAARRGLYSSRSVLQYCTVGLLWRPAPRLTLLLTDPTGSHQLRDLTGLHNTTTQQYYCKGPTAVCKAFNTWSLASDFYQNTKAVQISNLVDTVLVAW